MSSAERIKGLAAELRRQADSPRTNDAQRSELLLDAQVLNQALAELDELTAYRDNVRAVVADFRAGRGKTTSDIFKAVE